MTRLLVAGIGPRPEAQRTFVFAPGLRLASISGELVRAGNEVHLAEAFIHPTEYETKAGVPAGVAGHHILSPDFDNWTGELNELVSKVKPEAFIVLTDALALAAARCDYEGPLYIDYNGHPMAERQMQAAVHGSNAALADQWLHVLPVLLRADRFGVCSAAQRFALLGELGAAGRVNAETCGQELVDVLRPPVSFEEEFVPSTGAYMRGIRVPSDARVMLFTGGYNTWLDEELLFESVERVLADDPRAVYVSTGGEIHSHVTKVYQRFRAKVDQSRHAGRYYFVGWLEHSQYVDACLESDVGLFTDRPTLEGELGCRNRLYGYLWAGMRAVATRWAEIVRTELEPLGLVAAAPPKDVEAFTAALAQQLERGRCTESEAEQQRELLRRHCSPAAYYSSLVEWAGNPVRAADRVSMCMPRNNLVQLQQDFLRHAEDAEAARELVKRLRGSRLMSMYLKRHPEVNALLESIEEA